MEHKQHQSGSLNGFLLGVAVGVLVALLFTTKKGRHILKTFTEEGLDKVSLLEGLLSETEEEVIEGETLADITQEEVLPVKTQKKQSSTVSKMKASTRRFFRKPLRN